MQTEPLTRGRLVRALIVAVLASALTVTAISTSPAEASTAGPLLPPPTLTFAPTLTGGTAGTACGGTVRCVGAGGTYPTVAAAVTAAADGDTIQVQAGTYARFNAGSKSLTLLGGFGGGTWTNRNPSTNVTKIDATFGGGTGTAVYSDGATSFTIDGFTVVNGKAAAGDFGRYPGSGINITNAGSATVTHNDVEHNKDGVICNRCSTGGGINVDVSGSATISSNIVRDNQSSQGGGLGLSGSGTVSDNLIENNFGKADHGGGVYLRGADIVFRGNLVKGNSLDGTVGYSGWGGGAVLEGDSTTTGTVKGRFEHNTWFGNGLSHIDRGGGLFIDEAASATITGDLFYGNGCERGGGGLYVDSANDGTPSSTATIENITVADNPCSQPNGIGTGLTIEGSAVTMKNSIVLGDGGDSEVATYAAHDGHAASATVTYSHIGGATSGVTKGTGMVTTTPTFVTRTATVASNDYRLADGSSAIDAADPTSSVGSEPNSTRRDIGSYGGTTDGKAAGTGPGAPSAPAKPTASAGVESATVTWTTPALNGGTLTRYEVQTGSGATPAGCVNPTTTSCTATGLTAGTAVQFKVRVVTNGGTSAFSALSDAVTPTASGGDPTPGLPVMPDVWNGSCGTAASGTTYNVGPGQKYASIGAVPWQSLLPGDRVRIFYQSTAYKEKILLTESGTADHPITICGVPDSSGHKPIIDGNGATTKSTMQSDFAGTQDRGLITVAAQEGDPYGYKPKYIVIDGLEVTGAYLGNHYTDYLGQTQSYLHNAAGIFVERGEYITMRNLLVTGNSNGLFVASGNEEASISRHILVDANHFIGNGDVTDAYRDQVHQSYMSAEDIVYQFNHYDDLRPTAGGAALKDRSAGTVVRFNWFNAGSRYLDLVDAQDSDGDVNTCPTCLINLSSYRSTYVYGNVLVLNGDTTNPIHYGNDDDVAATSRQGTLYFFGNTVHSTHDQTNDVYSASLFDLSSNAESAQIWGNAFRATPATSGQTPTEWDLTRFHGKFNLGKNAFSPSMGKYRYPPVQNDPNTFNGTVDGTQWNNQLRPTNNDFGFTDASGGNFKPASGSVLIDASATAPVTVPARHALAFQYVKHQLALGRPVNGTVADLGAYENGPATSIGDGGGGGTSPSTVTLTLTPASQYYARPVTATVNVASGGTAATGPVSIAINGTTVRTGTLTNGVLEVRLPYTTAVGKKTVTASYGGSGVSDPATAETALTILRAPSTITANLAATTIHATSHAKVYNTVRIYKGVSGVYPTGYVTVKNGSSVLAKVKLSKGYAAAVLPLLRPGKYTLRSSYLGSTNVAGKASSYMTLTVVR